MGQKSGSSEITDGYVRKPKRQEFYTTRKIRHRQASENYKTKTGRGLPKMTNLKMQVLWNSRAAKTICGAWPNLKDAESQTASKQCVEMC